MEKIRIAVIQLLSKGTLPERQHHLADMVDQAAGKEPDIITLPEVWNGPYQSSMFPRFAEPVDGSSKKLLSALAKKHHVYLAGGTIAETEDGKNYNTAYVFNRSGEVIARHRKMHLFDINVSGGQKFRESDTLTAGDEVTVFETEFCRFGLCICYDLRFPELSRLMVDRGAKVILVPAAFNMTTGPVHWELLFRQRAVDNQAYYIGTAPARDLTADYKSWGHSIVTDPWGDVLVQMEAEEGIAVAEIDLGKLERIRRELPLLKHRRQDLYRVIETRSVQ